MDSPLTVALRQFEATEANLAKAERLVGEARGLIPKGIVFGGDRLYDDRCRALEEVVRHLPAIDGWKPQLGMMQLDDIAQWRLDAAEISEPLAEIGLLRALDEPSRQLEEYRFKLDRKRRALIRGSVIELMSKVEICLLQLGDELRGLEATEKAAEHIWEVLRSRIAEIETLLGSSAKHPSGWDSLTRHLRFGMVCDFGDIQKRDWPTVKAGLDKAIYGEDEPLPVETEDLADLVASKPQGPVTAKLKWVSITAEDFERLIFLLISGAKGYENPAWLIHTNAPDRGRDLSVFRVTTDVLSGTSRSRVIVQCRHRPASSISPADVSTLRDQMSLWDEPKVDVLIIATTGRFSADAVAMIEKHNVSDRALRIEMWPNSHLERLLASNPPLIAQFALR